MLRIKSVICAFCRTGTCGRHAGSHNSYAKPEAQMIDMVNVCDTSSIVFRYAWFIGRGTLPDNHFTYLFTPADGQLSELGQYYVNLPFTK